MENKAESVYDIDMCKKREFIILNALFFSCLVLLDFVSCSKKADEQSAEDIVSMDENAKKHKWYYFTDNSIEETEQIQDVPEVLYRPWTESIRLSGLASVPSNPLGLNQAYGVVNRLGILCIDGENATLSSDASIFSSDTEESMVFSEGNPIFYRYRSTFFGDDGEASSRKEGQRPFLVQYNPDSKLCFPLVNYENLNIKDNEEVTDFFWDGRTWACSVKSVNGDKVDFSFFYWEPLVNIIDLSPALGKEKFLFTPSSEEEYKELNLPHLFSSAPRELKKLLDSIPNDYTLFIKWRDDSGTSPVSYYQQGLNDIPLNGCASDFAESGYSAAIFADGTTYLYKKDIDKVVAFRLPKLPAGFVYGEGAMSGDWLYVGWEETNFYETGRSGFIKLNVNDVLALLD